MVKPSIYHQVIRQTTVTIDVNEALHKSGEVRKVVFFYSTSFKIIVVLCIKTISEEYKVVDPVHPKVDSETNAIDVPKLKRYDKANLAKAIHAVESKEFNIIEASIIFSIRRQTLARKLKNLYGYKYREVISKWKNRSQEKKKYINQLICTKRSNISECFFCYFWLKCYFSPCVFLL